jgi:hypothetical protein
MYAVGLEPCELKLDKMKLELLARIAANETTNSILQNSINDFNKNKDPKSVRYRLLGEVIDIIKRWDNNAITEDNIDVISYIKITKKKAKRRKNAR